MFGKNLSLGTQVNAQRCTLRHSVERKSELERRRRGSGEGGGVNFDMSFLKLSFDN